MSKRDYLVIALVTLLVAGFTYLYFSLERIDKEIDHGPTDKARRNPYLALQMHLDQKGVENALYRGFSGLHKLTLDDQKIGEDHTLILLHTYQSLYQSHLDALLQWVEQGGRLVVSVDNPYYNANETSSDLLLQTLGLRLIRRLRDYHHDQDDENEDEEDKEDSTRGESDSDQTAEQTPSCDEAQESPPGSPCKPIDRNQLHCQWQDHTELTWPSEPHPLQVSFHSNQAFRITNDATEALAYFGDDVAVARRVMGAGEIIVLSDATGLTNRNVSCYDNGFWFQLLTKDTPKVWFAMNADSPSFWRELWRLSAAGCIALMLALALWIWQQGTRFGPLFTVDRYHRRHFIDHIRAAATFLLRLDGSTTLIQTLRHDIIQKARTQHTRFAELTQQQQLEKLQQISAMPEADIELAMFRPLPLPASTLLEAIQRLQHLRNSL